jgi:4-carboxymuconolactone decarboxylase
MTSDLPSSFRPTELRFAPVATPDASVRSTLDKTVHDEAGQPLLIFRLLAHNEPLLRGFNSLGALMRNSDVTELRHREVIILRVAYRADCPFEFDQHLPVARGVGVSEKTIHAALGRGPAAALSVEDKLLLAIADEVFDHDSVSGETWSLAAEIWAAAQLVELVMTAGFFRMTAATINSIGLRPEEQW